ncbi:MAG TPA: NAD(P)H-binding protein [Chryseolinea sp.]|nr:NAD(P)H-binding protein [Chryseolinea sp.]
MEHDTLRRTRIVVIGANGGIGRHVVGQALKQNIQVAAVLRDPSRLTLVHQNLTVVRGDIMQPGTLDGVIQDNDIVVSAIGSNSLKETVLYSQGVRNIITSMQRTGLRRALFISASGLEVNPTHTWLIRFATRQILQRILRHMYADLERMEQVIKESNIDWTIVRPPRLVDEPETGIYRVSINKVLDNPMTISRADVSNYILGHLTDAETAKATVEIAY